MIKKALNWLKTALNDRITAILDQFDNKLDRELRDLSWDRPERLLKAAKSVRDFSKQAKRVKSGATCAAQCQSTESAPVIEPLSATNAVQLDLFIDKVLSAVDPEPESAPEQVKQAQEGLSATVKQLKPPVTADEGVQDADHSRLCAEIDQMLATRPDYDGSGCPTGDHPVVIDGFQPVMKLKTPKLQ